MAVALSAWTLLAADDPPADWVEPATGHRVIRLSDQPATASVYSHQNPYAAAGDVMTVSTRDALATIALASGKTTPLVTGRASHLVVGRKTRQAYYSGGSVITVLGCGALPRRKLQKARGRQDGRARDARLGDGRPGNAPVGSAPLDNGA